MWIAYSAAVSVTLLHVEWAGLFIGLLQLSIAAGIGSFDLIVLWLYIGVWQYRGNLKVWMARAFGTEKGLQEFQVCPRCGFKAVEEEGAKDFLRAKGAMVR